MAEISGRFGAYASKLTGQPAAYIAYFAFMACYITLTYKGLPIADDFKVVFYLLTGWFFADARTWILQNGKNTKGGKKPDVTDI